MLSQSFGLAKEWDGTETARPKRSRRWKQLMAEATQRQLGKYLESDRARLEEEGRRYARRNHIKKERNVGTSQAKSSRSRLLSHRARVSHYDIFSENNEDFEVEKAAIFEEEQDDRELNQMVSDLQLPEDQEHQGEEAKTEIKLPTKEEEEEPTKVPFSTAEDEAQADLASLPN